MKLSLIVAMTEERVIGKDNQMPWHLSEDLKRFKRITMGKPIIMGRKTHESIGKPLPGRANIVLSRDASFQGHGVLIARDLDEALQLARQAPGGDEEAFVIGGANVYELVLPRVDQLYITLIHQAFPGDTHFPDFDLEKAFKIVEKDFHPPQEGQPFGYTFMTAERQG